MMLRRILGLAPLALLLSLAGCGQELPAGGQREGEVVAVMTDDPGSPAPSLAPPPPGARLSVFQVAAPTGTITVEAQVSLIAAGGGLEALTLESPTPVLDIGSTSTAPLARADVSSIRYSSVRITFTKVEANLTGGLLVGGIDILGTVRVGLAVPAEVERAINLTVVELGHHEVIIDLNAESWLAQVDPVTRIIPSSALASAITLEAR